MGLGGSKRTGPRLPVFAAALPSEAGHVLGPLVLLRIFLQFSGWGSLCGFPDRDFPGL